MNENNPYEAPNASMETETDQNDIPNELNLANRWRRLVAKMIDHLIMMLLMIPWVVNFISQIDFQNPESIPQLDTMDLLKDPFYSGPMLLLLAVNYLMLYAFRASIGKKMLGMRIVAKDGSEIGFGRLLALREILMMVIGFIPFVGFIFGVVNVLMIFRSSHYCLHDDIAGTVVVMEGN